MGHFSVQNQSDHDLRLAVEPWAELEILAPKARADFTFADGPKSKVDIVYDGGNQVTVGLVSRDIKITWNGRTSHFEAEV